MKNLYKLIGIIVLGLFLNGCGTYYIASEYSDPIYDENYIPLDEVDSEEELEWKFNTDWRFRDDYFTFLTLQDYSFFSDMYWRNRMWRWGWTSSFDYYTNWQWNWYGSYAYWSPWNQYPFYGNWGSSYWYYYQWNNPWQHHSYVYGPRTNWLGNVYSGRRPNTFGNRESIANKIIVNRERPRVINNNNSNNVIITKPTSNTTRPVINNYTKPVNNSSKPSYNNNNNRPIYNNNYKPNNNSKPVYNNSNSRPSNNINFKPNNSNRSNSNSTPNKRGGRP